jgi:hypothetical protein
MEGVPAKVAQKVRVLLEDGYVHACPDEEVRKHQPRGTAADNAAADRPFLDVSSLADRWRCRRRFR